MPWSRARRLIEGPTRDFSAAAGEIVVYEGTNGMLTQQGEHDPDGLWLNFRNAKGNEVQPKQRRSELDWQSAFEFVPEP